MDYTVAHDLALALLRVSLGLMMAAHGYAKFFSGGRIKGTAGWFDSIGMRPGKLHAYLAAGTELGAGLAFALGLLTSLTGAAIVGVMTVAGWTSHRKNGFFIISEGWEYVAIISIAVIAVAMFGPGAYSIDSVLGIADDFDQWIGLALAGGLGVASGIALMAVFYRPPADGGDD